MGKGATLEGGWLLVEVYRGADGRDCSAGGVTGREVSLYVPHHEGNHDAPPEALRLWPRSKGGVRNFVPETLEKRGFRGCFGGNFVWTSDSRFRQLYGDHPVAVHDRQEG